MKWQCTPWNRKTILRRAFIFIAVALALPVACSPQVKDAAPEEPVFRSPFALKLQIDKEHYYQQKFDRVPYVANGDVYLFVGDSFGVNVEISGDRLSRITYQPDLSKADVEFKFTQEKTADGFMMLLATRNKLKRKLFFDALMTVPRKTEIYKTSVLPVEPNLSNFESWPDPIVQLILRDFRFSQSRPQ